MADISLDDLIKAKTQTMDNNADAQNWQVMTKKEEIEQVTKQTELISPEDRKRIDEIKESIDLTNSQTSVQYGINAQRNIAEFSDSILNNIRSKDSGHVGDLLSNLVVKVKGFDVDSKNSGGFIKKIPILGSLVGSAKSMMAEYDKLSVQIDKIQGELDKARMSMMKDIVMFDTMYQRNLEYFKELQLYIKAGEEKILELQQHTIPKLRMEAVNSQNQMAVQVVSDFENAVSRFEKKVHDLKLSKTIAIQTAPQIRLMQSAIYNTIPLWKSQIVIALGLSRQQKVLQMQREVTDTTNELLRRNAEMLKQNTIETARETERGIVDIETVKKVNEDLISTIEETIKIQKDGRERRKLAEAELVQIEDKLKQTLLAHR